MIDLHTKMINIETISFNEFYYSFSPLEYYLFIVSTHFTHYCFICSDKIIWYNLYNMGSCESVDEVEEPT